jgi:hypothetical protein
MVLLLLFSALLQSSQPQRPTRSRVPEFTVPQGWNVQLAGIDLRVTHATGASLTVMRSRHTEKLASYAQIAAEGWANPLGFARIGEPRHFSDAGQEWFEYEIHGNRLAERRRILYRATRNSSGLVEIMYENSEARFDTLLTEVHSIVGQFLSK